jgi:hypothetical protein
MAKLLQKKKTKTAQNNESHDEVSFLLSNSKKKRTSFISWVNWGNLTHAREK